MRTRLSRRSFLERAALASVTSLGLPVPAQAEGCPAPADPSPLLQGIGPAAGIRYRERLVGTIGATGDPLEMNLEIAIPSLRAFVQDPAHEGRIHGGRVTWAGHADHVPTEPGGVVRAFVACGDAATSRFELAFGFVDRTGRRLRLRGHKTLAAASGRDPAADLSRLELRVFDGQTEIARGEASEDCAQTLTRIASLAVSGARSREEEILARNAFLIFFNQACGALYPDLPGPFGFTGRLTPAEWRALSLAVRLMLPRPFPPAGPGVKEVVDNLERFVIHADQETIADLRGRLRLLGAFAPMVEGDIEPLCRAIEAQLSQRDATALKAGLDSLHKVAVLGYYSHPKADALVGYRRPRVVPLARICLPTKMRPSSRVFDVAIVGSGVAGSLLAERLTAAGKSVVILEAGPYVPEMQIDTDELLWIARLQKGSGLQLANENTPYARSARTFPVLQGACVGGGGMLNNAVCFQMPEARVTTWMEAGFPVPRATLRAAYQAVARELPIIPVSEATLHLNRSLRYLDLGPAGKPSVVDPPTPGFWECLVNLAERGCLGCGLCNTGCGSERKRNGLQVHLPRALAEGRDCELVPNARVAEIVVRRHVAGTPPRVAELLVRSGQEHIAVRAREFVLSAGAVHTTALLLRSPGVMSAAGGLPFGRRFFVNVASPVLGFYDTCIHPRPALQLTHYYYPRDPADAFLIEDLYNPPGQSALVMPGYGDLHARRMRRYASTALVGAVVPTSSYGTIAIDAAGRPVISVPLDEEIGRFRTALAFVAEAMLRGAQGVQPTSVIAGSNAGGFEMRDDDDVDRFKRWFVRFDQVALSTGHPQGGSAMSDDPAIGVVGGDFRVRGFANLRVCDGSLFPLAAGVNPQWTIMALAHHCGNVMNERA
jgi:choline dehydrogenase-like flavoprotein